MSSTDDLRVLPESQRAVLMRNPGQRDALADIRVQVDDFFRAVRVLQELLSFA